MQCGSTAGGRHAGPRSWSAGTRASKHEQGSCRDGRAFFDAVFDRATLLAIEVSHKIIRRGCCALYAPQLLWFGRCRTPRQRARSLPTKVGRVMRSSGPTFCRQPYHEVEHGVQIAIDGIAIPTGLTLLSSQLAPEADPAPELPCNTAPALWRSVSSSRKAGRQKHGRNSHCSSTTAYGADFRLSPEVSRPTRQIVFGLTPEVSEYRKHAGGSFPGDLTLHV